MLIVLLYQCSITIVIKASRRFLKLGVGLATTEGRMSSPCVGRRRLGEIGRPPGRRTRADARVRGRETES